MEDTSRIQMREAIVKWISRLENYPGWKEFSRAKLGHTLFFDEMDSEDIADSEEDFEFREDIEKERLLIIRYIGLNQTIDSLRECEYYFRRFPFRGLSVTRSNHITNICEMYFSRCYEYKQRLKEYLNTLNEITPGHIDNVGTFLKRFDKEFEQELQIRNRIHHRERFKDISIDRVFLRETLHDADDSEVKKQILKIEYRKVSKQWVQYVRNSGDKMDKFLEVVAKKTLECCKFLSHSNKTIEGIGG